MSELMKISGTNVYLSMDVVSCISAEGREVYDATTTP